MCLTASCIAVHAVPAAGAGGVRGAAGCGLPAAAEEQLGGQGRQRRRRLQQQRWGGRRTVRCLPCHVSSIACCASFILLS